MSSRRGRHRRAPSSRGDNNNNDDATNEGDEEDARRRSTRGEEQRERNHRTTTTTPGTTLGGDAMDRNVRARVDEIFNSLIENVNEDARAGIASYIAQLARDTASSSGGGSAPNKKQHQERLAEYAKQIQSSCTGGVAAFDDDAANPTKRNEKTTSTKMMKMPSKVEPTWREYATEEQLVNFLNANDANITVKWGKKKLLDLCEKHLAKVTEPALKISKELVTVTNAFEEWMHAVGKKNANKTFVEVAKQDENELLSSSMAGLSSKDKATEILNELRACEREATEHIEYIKNNLDPFKVMQYPVHGCSILDLSYVHVDFSNRVMIGLFPILEAASHGSETGGKFYDLGQKERNCRKKTHRYKSWTTLGLELVQVAGKCMEYVFAIIGTSLNESNLTDPEKATKFLVELCSLREKWRCSSKEMVASKLTTSFLEMLVLNDPKLKKLYAAGEREDVDEEERRRIVMQLPPHALTQLHESFHGVTRPSSEYCVPPDLTWECLWIPPTPSFKVGGGSNNGDDVSDDDNNVVNNNNVTRNNNRINNNDVDDERGPLNNMTAVEQDFVANYRRRNQAIGDIRTDAIPRARDAHSARFHPYAGFPPMMPMEDVDHEEDDEEEQEEEREDDNGDRDAPSPFVRLRERRDREPHRLRTMARRLRILGRPGLSGRNLAREVSEFSQLFEDDRRRQYEDQQERINYGAVQRLLEGDGRAYGANSARILELARANSTHLRSRTTNWSTNPALYRHDPSLRGVRMHDDRFGRDMDLHSPLIPPDRARAHGPRMTIDTDVTNVTYTVSHLVRRLRSIGPPPDGRWKSRSPMFIRLIEHIVRWELLGNATFVTPDVYPQRFPVADRLAKLIPQSGRWMVILVRGLGLHCVPMLHCILHGLRSNKPKMREFEGHPGAIFCAGAATCVRLALESIIKNDGKPPSVLSQEYWKTLAHVGECLMFWCIGGKRYFHEIPAESIISDRKMRSRAVARKAVLAGLAGDDIDNWGIAIAKGAPLMLSALSQTETVSQSTMDAVSGVLFLISHLIEQEARIDPRWRNALQMAKMSTLPKEIIASLFECQTWANEVTAAVHRTMAGKTPIDALIEKESNDSNAHTTDPKNKKVSASVGNKKRPAPGSEMQAIQNFDFRDPKNTRKGIRFGFLIALVATWSHGKPGFMDAKYLDTFINSDDVDANCGAHHHRETKLRKKNISTTPKQAMMVASSTATSSTHLFKIILSSLERCGDGLLAAIEPLARIGWALDGENSGIRGVLQQIGKAKFLGEFAGEFPVHSPSQQLVDMIQLLLHAAVELRNYASSNGDDYVYMPCHYLESRREILGSLLTHANWKRSFSCLECIAPNMFYFGSSLDLVGAANVIFPPSFRVLRLKNDLKRLLSDMHGNVPQISVKLRRAMPCDDAWRAIKNAVGPLLGRTFSCSFDSEDGVGNGVAREAWTVLIQALLEGHPTRVGPSEAVFTSWSNTKGLRRDSTMSLSAMHSGDHDDLPSFEGALRTLRPDCSPHAARFAGRIVGLLISNEKTADLPLVPWLWQALLHKPLKAELLAQVDDDFKRTLLPIKTCDWSDPRISWVKEDPPAFVIAAPTRADPNKVKELVPGGANVFVDERNRGEYVDLYAQHCMIRCSTTLANSTLGLPSSSSLFSPSDESDDIQTKQNISVNLAAFSSGFDEVVPRELVSSWEWEDLELLVCGLQDINVISWEQATTYEPKPPPHCTLAVTTETRARWFWDAVKSMNSEQKHALLHFWTAFRKLPHTGFRGLRFNLRFDDQKSSNHLPMAQTCFFTLRVPNYASYEETKEKLLKAISECCFGFGFS